MIRYSILQLSQKCLGRVRIQLNP